MSTMKPDDYVYTAIDAIDEISCGSTRKNEPKPSSGKNKWNKLNRWQNAWLVSVVIQKLIIVLISLPTMGFSFAFIMIIIVLNVNCLVYGVGLAIAWGLRRVRA